MVFWEIPVSVPANGSGLDSLSFAEGIGLSYERRYYGIRSSLSVNYERKGHRLDPGDRAGRRVGRGLAVSRRARPPAGVRAATARDRGGGSRERPGHQRPEGRTDEPGGPIPARRRGRGRGGHQRTGTLLSVPDPRVAPGRERYPGRNADPRELRAAFGNGRGVRASRPRGGDDLRRHRRTME